MFFFKVLDEPLTFYGIVRSFSDMSEVFLVSDAKIHLFILIAPLQKTTQLLLKKTTVTGTRCCYVASIQTHPNVETQRYLCSQKC